MNYRESALSASSVISSVTSTVTSTVTLPFIGLRLATMSAVVLVLLTLGCQGSPEDVDSTADEETPAADVVDTAAFEARAREALENPNRPEADRADDALRKPEEVLAFLQIEPGMRVLDLLAGGGYYTELLAAIVGDEGEVICQNNAPYIGFMGESYDDRFKDDRLPNVTRLDSELSDLVFEDGSLDAIVFVLGYHDTYFEPPDGSWPKIDNPALLETLYAALAPGGILGVVDHAADPGGDTVEVATTLHRIDPAVVLADFENAGFVLDGESHVLRNPEDNKTINVFDPTVRRKTDRFIYRFRKP